MNEDYLGRIDPVSEEWKTSKWADLLEERYFVASLFTEGKVVLDSCCGTGFGAVNFIAPKALFIVGIDICESAAEKYGRSYKYEFLNMDGRDLKLDTGAFDVVLTLDAIEHFNNMDGARYLSEIKRVCKEDGMVIGTTPLVIDDSLIASYLEWNKFHLFMYTKETLKRALRDKFSFVKIYEIYSQHCPYFLFICGQSQTGMAFEAEEKIIRYISENNDILNKAKAVNYLEWAKALLSKNKLFKAAYLLLAACLIKSKGAFRCR